MRLPQRIRFDLPGDRNLRLLIVATVTNVLGYQVFVPVLPLYLGKLGSAPDLIGLITGIGLLAYGLGQYPAGLLADRFDRRVVAAFATIAYGAVFLLYLLPLSLPAAILVRLVHAFVGGFFTPASLALAADLAPPGKVSRGFGMWQATVMGGFLVGPLLGGIVASFSLVLVFILAAALCFASSIPVLFIARSALATRTHATALIPTIDLSASRARRLLPAMLSSAAPEYLSGAIIGIWAIYVAGLGGEAWQIGLSFTVYALPAVLLSVWYGGVVDRRGGRLVMAGCLIAIAVLMPLYVVIAAVPLLLVLLALTGTAVAAEKPVVYSEVVRVAEPSEYARAQAVLQIGLMVSQSIGAIVAGYLYGFSPALVFVSIAIMCALSLLAVPRLQARRPPIRFVGADNPISPEAAPGNRSGSRPGPAE